jgi:two-component system LytT family response regulator
MAERGFYALIADDEPGARAIIKGFLQQSFPDILIAGEASGVAEALDLINKHSVDLLFLDIEMEDGTGFQLLDQLPDIKFPVIFTTAHNDFAIRAFRYHAIDYLLKPIDPDEFIEAVRKAKQYTDLQSLRDQYSQLLRIQHDKSFDRITLTTSEGNVFADVKDIIRLETYGNYSFVFLSGHNRLLVSRNLKEFEEILPAPDFFRVHQSHIVNTSFVKKLVKGESDHAVMTDDVKIPVSRRRREDFKNILQGKTR